MYAKKDYARLKGAAGFSDQALETHFALYEGYVNNTNKVLELLAGAAKDSPIYGELKRRLGWEFDGMRLHEYYFGNLGGDGDIEKAGTLKKALVESFGSLEKWQEDFLATGKLRGIGWAALYQDVESGQLLNFWINEHDGGHPAGQKLLLIMDVFEHAYFPDYGKDRGAYIAAFMKNIDWAAVEARFA